MSRIDDEGVKIQELLSRAQEKIRWGKKYSPERFFVAQRIRAFRKMDWHVDDEVIAAGGHLPNVRSLLQAPVAWALLAGAISSTQNPLP